VGVAVPPSLAGMLIKQLQQSVSWGALKMQHRKVQDWKMTDLKIT